MVQCGSTLAKACFLGWRQCPRHSIIGIVGLSFLVRGAQEGIGNALIFEGSLKNAFSAVRRDFYMVLEALGGVHQEHQEQPRSTQGGLWRRLGNSLKSSDLEESITAPKTEKRSPNCVDDARVRRARARAPPPVRQHHTHNSAPVSRILTSGNLPAVIFHKIWHSNAKSTCICTCLCVYVYRYI